MSEPRKRADEESAPSRPDESREQQRGPAPWFRYASAASVGIEIAVAIAGTTLVAHWLETHYTHWAPWTTVIGFVIGVGAAIKALVRTSRDYMRAREEAEVESVPAPGAESAEDSRSDRGVG